MDEETDRGDHSVMDLPTLFAFEEECLFPCVYLGTNSTSKLAVRPPPVSFATNSMYIGRCLWERRTCLES